MCKGVVHACVVYATPSCLVSTEVKSRCQDTPNLVLSCHMGAGIKPGSFAVEAISPADIFKILTSTAWCTLSGTEHTRARWQGIEKNETSWDHLQQQMGYLRQFSSFSCNPQVFLSELDYLHFLLCFSLQFCDKISADVKLGGAWRSKPELGSRGRQVSVRWRLAWSTKNV